MVIIRVDNISELFIISYDLPTVVFNIHEFQQVEYKLLSL